MTTPRLRQTSYLMSGFENYRCFSMLTYYSHKNKITLHNVKAEKSNKKHPISRKITFHLPHFY